MEPMDLTEHAPGGNGLVAINAHTGVVMATALEIAATRAARRRGLLGRSALVPGSALWIVPSRGVHTCGMRFAIDVVALDARGVVVDVVTDLRPWRVRLPRPGTLGVLELPAGTVMASRTRLGHRIEFQQSNQASDGGVFGAGRRAS
jgi:uncharacterized membrane protein (UPF0127 family)